LFLFTTLKNGTLNHYTGEFSETCQLDFPRCYHDIEPATLFTTSKTLKDSLHDAGAFWEICRLDFDKYHRVQP
jgi:hypothetical protein